MVGALVDGVKEFDPLSPEGRARELGRARPKRALPIAPVAPRGRRQLPLADVARPVDLKHRPIYAVWEITLACDLACRHCGSRAGKERPDELSTSEALDLVAQLADLGTKEVTLIGGEAYLREDWLDIVRAIRKHGMEVTMTTGGRGLTPELIAKAHDAGLMGASVSIDGDEETHDRLRGVTGSYRAAILAMTTMRARKMRVACNSQINRLSVPHLSGILETIGALGIHSWQIQLTVPMGRAADEPDVLLQPYDLLELFPQLASLKARCDELKVRMWPGNNIGYFGPYESVIRGYRRHQGLPFAPVQRLDRRQHPRREARGHLVPRRAPPVHAGPQTRGPLGLLQDLLLRRRVHEWLHLDERRNARKAGQQPVLPSSRARDAAPGQA